MVLSYQGVNGLNSQAVSMMFIDGLGLSFTTILSNHDEI